MTMPCFCVSMNFYRESFFIKNVYCHVLPSCLFGSHTNVRKRCTETSGKLAGSYNPLPVEDKLHDFWVKQGVCEPKSFAGKHPTSTYSLLLPPPNVTGSLHLGHSLTVTIQDVLARWNRMSGKKVLWVPGLDHAGIATQTTFEKVLWKEKKKTRHMLGRKEFQKQLWDWQNKKHNMIVQQLRKMGVTLDWSREYFTLDNKHSEAVSRAFIQLHDNGLIYRLNSIVNWSCKLQSSISDIEVDHIEIEGPTLLNVPNYETPVEFGVLSEFAYKSVDNGSELVVSTTRLETMLGDTAVAVHPDDERYKKWHKALLWHPIRKEQIPVVCDESVDPAFGTGAVKVTPAHSLVDFEIAERNNLQHLSVINEDGTMNELCGKYHGLKRFEVRKHLKDELIALGLFRSQKSHPMSVPVCSRTGDVLEFLLKPQWFLSCREMAKLALLAVENEDLTILPQSYKNVWLTWLGNARDWCISRQLWWGHRIPVYKCGVEGREEVWVAAENLEKAQEKAADRLCLLPSARKNVQVTQDDDVLDTWFSSALLPFAVHGWPHDTQDLKEFYPLSIMETGHDILFFWVARMVMLGTYLTGKLPFRKILLHGIVCDSHGRKMSKSLGNAIDPQDVIYGTSLKKLSEKTYTSFNSGLMSQEELNKTLESNKMMFPNGIPECGTDALRFSLCSHNINGCNVNFDINVCLSNRQFCNKIWQACRYIERSYVEVVDVCKWPETIEPMKMSKMDKWILSRLASLVVDVDRAMNSHSFHLATGALKTFLYDEFCSIYLESTKQIVKTKEESSVTAVQVLIFCMDNALRVLSPFMPFVTEHLYQHLPVVRNCAFEESIAIAPFPSPQEFLLHRDEKIEEEIRNLLDIITTIRYLKSTHNITKKDDPLGYIVFSSSESQQQYLEHESTISSLTGISRIRVTNEVPNNLKNNGVSKIFGEENHVYLDVSEKKHDANTVLIKTIRYKTVLRDLQKLHERMKHPGYISSAPASVQKAHLQKMTKLEAELQELEKFKNISKAENV